MPTTATSHDARNDVVDAIHQSYPEGSVWMAMEAWARDSNVDPGTFCSEFQTDDPQADILMTFGALLAAIPDFDRNITGATADALTKVTRSDEVKVQAVRTGVQWAIDSVIAKHNTTAGSRAANLLAYLTPDDKDSKS
jgi:hypothetical protein